MKIRIESQKLCVRISNTELKALEQGEALSCFVDLPSALRFTLQVNVLPNQQVINLQQSISVNEAHYILHLSPQGLIELSTQPQLPLRDLIAQHEGEVVVEVDFDKRSKK